MLTISEEVKAMDVLLDSYQEAARDNAVALQKIPNIERDSASSVCAGKLFVTVADAQVLTQLSGKHGGDWALEAVLPLVKKQTPAAKLTIGFLTGLFRQGDANKLGRKTAQILFVTLQPSQRTPSRHPWPCNARGL